MERRRSSLHGNVVSTTTGPVVTSLDTKPELEPGVEPEVEPEKPLDEKPLDDKPVSETVFFPPFLVYGVWSWTQWQCVSENDVKRCPYKRGVLISDDRRHL